MLTCRQPDRDFSRMLCGYPLPCPYHTAILDTTTKPPEVRIPVTATGALESRRILAEVLETITKGEMMPGHTPKERKKRKGPRRKGQKKGNKKK